MNGSLVYLVTLLAGLGFQFLSRWSVTKNLWISLLILVLLPPSISFGLVCGIWVGCAFIPFSSSIKRPTNNFQVGWGEVIAYSLWIFAGFILTLVYLFKIKHGGNMETGQSEALAWVFLTMIELCICRIIACSVPSWSRSALGCRIGFINFLLMLYWLYPYGWFVIGLTFITFLVVFPLLLAWMDFPNNDSDVIVTGGR
ncbi:MAG TPA: hypothetical protein VEC37_01355 [Bacillota bacterium]|nr:hypothetical protein [Bacillota bacterium]